MSRSVPILVIVFLVAAGGIAHAQVDLTGSWNLQTSVALPNEGGTCEYAGSVQLAQSGSSVSGPANLFLVSGGDACPAEMSGDLQAIVDSSVEGIFLQEGFITGPLGTTSFFGQISPNPGGSGTFAVTQGPFDGAGGTWSAELLQSVLEIPSATPVGLTLLTLLLLASGAWMLGRHAA